MDQITAPLEPVVFSNPLKHVRDEVAALPDLQQHRARWPTGIAALAGRAKRALQTIRHEPEILLFAVMQWAVVAVGYAAWFQILKMMPSEPTLVSPDPGSMIAATVLAVVIGALWSVGIVILFALPVGLLSAAMGTAHILRRMGQPSTLARCLTVACAQLRPLWTYHAFDGWVTVNAVLDRFPKRNGNRSSFEALTRELLYFAWKLGCAGVLPAMICGHGVIESGRRSIAFVKARLVELAALRAGYAVICWAVGAAAYVASFMVVFNYPHVIPTWMMSGSGIDMVVKLTGVPMMTALAIVLVVLQPIYILSVCDLYADHLDAQGETVVLPEVEAAAASRGMSVVAYAAVAVLAAICTHQFGFADWMLAMRGSAA